MIIIDNFFWGGVFMAKPIEDTPILYGPVATDFFSINVSVNKDTYPIIGC